MNRLRAWPVNIAMATAVIRNVATSKQKQTKMKQKIKKNILYDIVIHPISVLLLHLRLQKKKDMVLGSVLAK